MPESAWNPFSQVSWTNSAPDASRKMIAVWKAKKAAPINAICLSESVYGVYIHWLGKRSAPCLSNGPVQCPFCAIQVPRRWEGYLAGYSERTGKVYLLHLSKGASLSCPDIASGKANLRGCRIIVERRGNNPNSPCVARVEYGSQLNFKLPSEFNVKAQLMQIWSGEGGLSALMANCKTIEEARAMFVPALGIDE